MATHRGIANTGELFSQGLVETRRDDNGFWRPYIRFRQRPVRMCPFLQNSVTATGSIQGKCILHPFDKPLVCHLAPLGRILDLETNHEQWQVYEPAPGCPGMGIGELRTLSQELSPFQSRLDAEAEFFAELEKLSPTCIDEAEAIVRLFSFEVRAEIVRKIPG